MGGTCAEKNTAAQLVSECQGTKVPKVPSAKVLRRSARAIHNVKMSSVPYLGVYNEEDEKERCIRTCLEHFSQAIEFATWDPCQFDFSHVMMPNLRSGGQIELYVDRMTGEERIVKRLPADRLQGSREEFRQANPHDLEDPWKEIEVAMRFGNEQCRLLPGVCRCLGIYKDINGDALILTEHLRGGDLFNVAQRKEEPGPMREAMIWPIVKSLLNVVLSLHSFGVAHGDLSLENAVLREHDSTDVVLIDFAMSCTEDIHTASAVRGKPSYQAPEMYTHATYDMRCSDLFACGVAAYSLAVRGYPWTQTRPGADAAFTFAMEHGIQAFLKKRRISGGKSKRVSEVMSPQFRTMLEFLLHPDPYQRHRALEIFSEDWKAEDVANINYAGS
mmetsp:Transcript_11210/g.25565  ORF Transcript_11210/g.25565 Transcript_11210/m.25565 type:complete len:388 (-) Transcript_11210:36-1199(-)